MISKIIWSKLEPYKRDKSRSFEELCYQIARGLYENKGRFTSIDDSGGGDGVEFYLTLPNGDQWGWQAKFYYEPDGRLNTGNRKQSIKNSLATACQKHSRLRKWILCTPTSFTPDPQDKHRTGIKGEQTWFDEELSKSIPPGMKVKLEHWGDSEFNYWLSQPRFEGKLFYFFGELELTLNWFRTQFEKQRAYISDKFIPFLHTETDIDYSVHALIGDNEFIQDLQKQIAHVEHQLKGYKEAVGDLSAYRHHQIDWSEIRSEFLIKAESLQDTLNNAIEGAKEAVESLEEGHYEYARRTDQSLIVGSIKQALYKYDEYTEANSNIDVSKIHHRGKDESRKSLLDKVMEVVAQPKLKAAGLMYSLEAISSRLACLDEKVLHILGDAGMGKTHMVCNICYERLETGLPAILVSGSRFTTRRSIEDHLRSILDIPPAYSWGNFLQALSTAAEAYRTRIPLVFDGLNDASQDGIFSTIWRLGLPGLAQEISTTGNVVLITTCRSTYKEAIWPDGNPPNMRYVYGFYDVETAVRKYFAYYKIRADVTGTPLLQFRHPIYLRIFCEIQNPDRHEEKDVYIGEQTLFEVFDKYIGQCNRTVCERLGLYDKTPLLRTGLDRIAKHLWLNHQRSIPVTELSEILDKKPLDELEWSQSKTKAILDEGLLICRNWHGGEEVAHFTYDLLGGYVIAQYLTKRAGDNLATFLNSEEVKAALFSEDYEILHPMYDDIRRCLAMLIPIQTGSYLHELVDTPIAWDSSIKALFEIAPSYVTGDCTDLLTHLSQNPDNLKLLLKLAITTIGHVGHPLNASFWSGILKNLSMPERDISWTEYVRQNAERFDRILEDLELACRRDTPLPEVMEYRLHLLAEHVIWTLTSTVRALRDKATRALYWYGRRFPRAFLDLVISSLELNDPYVPERMLAATYGIAMARQHDFSDPSFVKSVLPDYGRRLYEEIFSPHAAHSTTHTLARDYARHTIDVALLHHPDLLTAGERKRTIPPFTDGGIREWGESEDKNEKEYRGGNRPMQMDFMNYTLGRLVRDRRNYDFQNEEYKRVLANIFWRMYELGYSLEAFCEVDQELARANWEYGRLGDGTKTDRYGKKYSWIAFFELAGLRQDQGLLETDDLMSKTDIDPSFPVEVQQYNHVQIDFLTGQTMTVEDWILKGGFPDIEPYLVCNQLCDELGSWVLLDGFINQQEAEAKRGIFTFIRCFVVKSEEMDQITERLKQQDLGGRWLPEIPADYYTYAGEIPWCDMYPANDWSELSFVIDRKCVPIHTERQVFVKDGKRMSKAEINDLLLDGVLKLLTKGDEEALPATLREQNIELRIETIESEEQIEERETFRVLIPVRENNWESYHSSIIPARNVAVPARQIADHLDLCSQPQTFDLFEKNGRRASLTFHHGDDFRSKQHFAYLRRDLLDRFLEETNSGLIWGIWGEREYYSEEIKEREAFAEKNVPYKVFQDIRIYEL